MANRAELIGPTNNIFKSTGIELSHFHVSIDLFVLATKDVYTNANTMADLARYSNGKFFYYQNYNYSEHGIKFDTDLYQSLTQNVSWESVGRVRVSSGFKQMGIYGNFLIKKRTADLLSLPVCDQNSFIFYEIERDPMNKEPAESKEKEKYRRRRNLSESATHFFVQTALLYTNSESQRKIRVHNIALPVTTKPTEIFDTLDMEAYLAFAARKANSRLEETFNIAGTRSLIELFCANVCTSVNSIFRNQQPATLDYFIQYHLGIIKNEGFSPTQGLNTNEYLDYFSYLKFMLRAMNA